MSQDVIADGLNEMMNAKRAKRNFARLKKHSKLLVSVLELAKKEGYVNELKIKDKELEVKFSLNECKAIKPRFNVSVEKIEKYIRRYLPARGFGILIISTSQGLMTQEKAYEKNIGGSLIAYFY